jgi:hypothetical protein
MQPSVQPYARHIRKINIDNFDAKSEDTLPLGRPRRRMENNIQMGVKETYLKF